MKDRSNTGYAPPLHSALICFSITGTEGNTSQYWDLSIGHLSFHPFFPLNHLLCALSLLLLVPCKENQSDITQYTRVWVFLKCLLFLKTYCLFQVESRVHF